MRSRPDTKSEAYQHYLRGMGYLQEYHKPENLQSAIAEFGLALQIDPNYSGAYAGTGEAYWLGFEESNRTNDWIGKAAENCRKSLSTPLRVPRVTVAWARSITAKGNIKERWTSSSERSLWTAAGIMRSEASPMPMKS